MTTQHLTRAAAFPRLSVRTAVLIALVVFACLVAFTGVFQANNFDSDTIRAGALATLRGDNPYRDAGGDGLSAYFNPPHSVFVYPLMLASGTIYVLSLVLVVALAVQVFENDWLALYVASPAFIVHGIGANNLGLQVGVLGVVCLWLARERQDWTGAALIAFGYGLLLIKPQVGLGIVALHGVWLLWRRDGRLLLRVMAIGALWFVVLPTVVNRTIWLDWWRDVVSNRLLDPVGDVRIDPETDMEPFINKWGFVGTLLLTLVSVAAWWERRDD